MRRLCFPLLSGNACEAFEQATKLLNQARGAGWTVTGLGTGFAGGLPAGRFTLANGPATETISFRLDPKTLAAMQAALRGEGVTDAEQLVVTSVRSECRDDARQAIIRFRRIPLATRATPVRRVRAAARQLPRQAALAQPSIYDLTEEAALRGLRDDKGPAADQLRALVGADFYRTLRALAERGATRRGPGEGKALVLHGIMGSKLGKRASLAGLIDYNDVIWLDPVDMRLGRLAELALDPQGRPQHGTQSVGVLYSFYLRLKLSLAAAGFDAEFYDYDWRRPIQELGAEFAAFLDQQTAPVTIVAHSMGGVVARAALKQGAGMVKRLVMIGTPNHGSFVPVQALRAVYPFLKQLSVLFDRDLPTITEEIFAGFPGLYDLLPAAAKFPDFPMFDPQFWPKSHPRVRGEWLRKAASAQDLLAPADERFHLICGVNQETVVGLRQDYGEFVFLQSRDGDGTVPRVSAELPGCPTLYVDGSHPLLPNLGEVCDLAVDLAREGSTKRETLDWKPSGEAPKEIPEAQLRAVAESVRGWKRGQEPSPEVFREMLAPLLALPKSLPEPALKTDREPVIISRRRQRQLEVALFPGSLTQVSSRAYLLGLFQGVAPTGAASAVDALMNGVIADLVKRRMLSGRFGEVFIVPKGRTFIAADHVIFVGLGPFDHYQKRQANEAGEPEAMRLICESAVRTCLHANVEEFATVLLGASAAEDTGEALRRFTRGFLDALAVADPEQRIRRITLCENDPQQLESLGNALYGMAATDLFADVELELRRLPAPVVAPEPPRRGLAPAPPSPLYLLCRVVEPTKDQPQVRVETSLLLPRSKAAVLTREQRWDPKRRLDLFARIAGGELDPGALAALGSDLADFVFDAELRSALGEIVGRHESLPLVVVHDAPASQLPWETFRCGDWVPALSGGVVRQHLDANLSVAKWLETRAEDDTLEVLLVVNPTEDLTGAEQEGDRVRRLLSGLPRVRLSERRRHEATRARLLEDFRSGKFDVIHYAGHAWFEPSHPGRSGLLCAGGEPLTGTDLAGLGSLPSLVFFNACESGRLADRGGKVAKAKKPKPTKPSEAAATAAKNVSVANAFIRGGVVNFLGTYWPVGDKTALKFSEKFYQGLLDHQPIGQAVLAARMALKKEEWVDWADYLLYGDPNAVLKPNPT